MDTLENDIPSMVTTPFSQIVAGVLLFIALLNGEHILATLLLLLLALVAGTKLWSRKSFGRLVISASVDINRLFPEDKCTFNIRVKNNSWLPVWLKIDVTADGALKPIDPDVLDTLISRESSMLWYQQAHFEWDVRAHRRGVYRIGTTKVRAGDLFGFFPEDQHLQDYQQVYVYPRVVPLVHFPLSRQDIWGVPGTVHPIKDPIYLLGTRNYQHSQPAKYIHWKASARVNCLQEKLFESTSQEKVLLLLDVEHYTNLLAEEQFERTIEVLASLGLRLMEQGLTVGFVTNGRMTAGASQILPLSHRRYQAQALLELLAQVSMETTEELCAILSRDGNFLRNVSCAHFSYCHDRTTLDFTRMIQQRRLPAAFIACQFATDINEMRQINISGKQYQLEDLRLP